MSHPDSAAAPSLPPDAGSLATRRSLLSRLRDHDDHRSWQEFFDTYHPLILSVARRSGLSESDAQEVLQETIISVSREMPRFVYDRSKGRFKSWLLTIARRRIADQLRKRYREGAGHDRLDPNLTSVEAEISAQAEATAGQVWEEEWKKHVLHAAIERVRRQSRPQQFQMFEKTVLDGWSIADTSRALDVSQMQIYLARLRIGRQIKAEVRRLSEKML